QEGMAHVLRDVQYGADARVTHDVVIRWRFGLPKKRGEPWYLLTDLEGRGESLCQLYGCRSRGEGQRKALKQTMKKDVLKCMTVDGVLKELTMYAMAYNLVRVAMCQAVGRQDVVPDRVSFIDALRWPRGAETGEEMPELVVNPLRPGRYE